MENKLILEGSFGERYIVVCFRNKVQEYAFFDSEKEAFNWWQNHKHPFFENDRPKGWGVSFALTYDTVDEKIIEWNKLYLDEEIVDGYIKEMKSFISILETQIKPQ